MEIVSNSITETKKVAKRILDDINKGNEALIFGLRGDLGSGKTTFVKVVAELLGLKRVVTSPTFVIEKIYHLENKSFKHLIHIDAYRLGNGKELLALGWQEISNDPANLIFIEWPGNVQDVLPENIKYIDFKFVDENSRKIIYG